MEGLRLETGCHELRQRNPNVLPRDLLDNAAYFWLLSADAAFASATFSSYHRSLLERT